MGLTEIEVLRGIDLDPVPDSVEEEAEAAARARLRALIAEEQAGPARRVAWPAPWLRPGDWRGALAQLALGAAAVVVLLAVAGLVLTSLRPRAVEAQLTDLARVAEEATSPVAPAGGFVYGVIEQRTLIQESAADGSLISFVRFDVRESWLASDGRLRIRTTNRGVEFFTDDDRAAFASSSLAVNHRPGGIDEVDLAPATHPENSLEMWSTDPDELARQLDAETAASGDVARSARLLEAGANLLRSTAARPALRAAVLRVLADLPDLEVTDLEFPAGPQTLVVAEYRQGDARLRQTLTFDTETAHLLEQRITTLDELPDGIPAGTEVSIRTVQPPTVVGSIPPAAG